jgi:hypothetical protein
MHTPTVFTLSMNLKSTIESAKSLVHTRYGTQGQNCPIPSPKSIGNIYLFCDPRAMNQSFQVSIDIYRLLHSGFGVIHIRNISLDIKDLLSIKRSRKGGTLVLWHNIK